jgi:G3E family GTPase
MVTVVDAYNFFTDYPSTDLLKTRGEHLGADDERTVADLLVDQIEFADVIVLNKIDLLSKESLTTLSAMMGQLNPRAKVVHAVRGAVPLDQVMARSRPRPRNTVSRPGSTRRGSHSTRSVCST